MWARAGVEENDSLTPGAIWGRPEREPPHSGVSYYTRDADGRYRTFPRTFRGGSYPLDTFHWAIVKAYCEREEERTLALGGASSACPSLLASHETSAYIRPRFRKYPEMDYTIGQLLSFPPTDGNILQDRVVILGSTYDADQHLSPIGPLSGTDITGQLVEAELGGQTFRELPFWAMCVIKAALGLVIVWFYRIWGNHPRLALAMSVGLLSTVVLSVTVVAFYVGWFWIDAGIFLIAILVEQMAEATNAAHHRTRGVLHRGT